METSHYAEALYAHGYWLLMDDQPRQAATFFRAMSVYAPIDVRCWLGLGHCHEKNGQFEIALELYAVGALLSRAGARCLAARAALLDRLGRVDDTSQPLFSHVQASYEPQEIP